MPCHLSLHTHTHTASLSVSIYSPAHLNDRVKGLRHSHLELGRQDKVKAVFSLCQRVGDSCLAEYLEGGDAAVDVDRMEEAFGRHKELLVLVSPSDGRDDFLRWGERHTYKMTTLFPFGCVRVVGLCTCVCMCVYK